MLITTRELHRPARDVRTGPSAHEHAAAPGRLLRIFLDEIDAERNNRHERKDKPMGAHEAVAEVAMVKSHAMKHETAGVEIE